MRALVNRISRVKSADGWVRLPRTLEDNNMNFIEWNIIEDDFNLANKAWEAGNRSWCLVNCKVDFQGKIYKWCLHYDAYMYRKLCIEREQMLKENKVPLSVFHNTEIEIQYWLQEIKEREQAEDEAGEDL